MVDAVRLSDAELRDVAERLTAEFADVPQSSVLRCLARAVHRARVDGLPADQLPSAGERIALRFARHWAGGTALESRYLRLARLVCLNLTSRADELLALAQLVPFGVRLSTGRFPPVSLVGRAFISRGMISHAEMSPGRAR